MFKKITLYVVRLSKQDTLKDSRPCINCHKRLKEWGIKKIVYSTDCGLEEVKTQDYIPQKYSLGHRYIRDGYQHRPESDSDTISETDSSSGSET